LRNFNNCSTRLSIFYLSISIDLIPVSPFSAARKRINSECEVGNDDDDDDDDVEFKSLLFVYDDKSAISVEEVKRFSTTRIRIKEIQSIDRNK
jgi:hypothetical protein